LHGVILKRSYKAMKLIWWHTYVLYHPVWCMKSEEE